MKGKAILVSDDDSRVVETVRRMLDEANVLNPVHSVEDGAGAIAYLAGSGKYSDRNLYPYPALLLLDLVMPQKSGLEVLKWIQRSEEPKHRTLGIVVMTAMGNIEELKQAYSLGAHSFLIKPLLVADVANLLNGLRGIRFESDERGRYVDFEATRSNRWNIGFLNS